MRKLIPLVAVALISSMVSYLIFEAFQTSTQSIQQAYTSEYSSFPRMVNTSFNSNSAAFEVDFTKTVEKVIDGVVHVKNIGQYDRRQTWWMQSLYGERMPDKVGTGSGVVVSPDGLIITNNHVIDEASTIEITTNDNKTYEAELIGTDAYTDIAVLKIKGDHRFDYLTFGDSDAANVGEWVLAVGNPFNLNSTVTAGIISAKSRDLNQRDQKNQSFIQTDAAVNVGNSGGALVNTQGELIGINTAITSVGGGFVGYSFAVPSNIARKVFEDILEYGNVQKGLLGVAGRALDSKMADQLDLSETEGFYIQTLEEGMGAERAGLAPKDIIKSVDGNNINKFSDLTGYLSTKRPGDRVALDYIRDGVRKTVTVELNKLKRTFFYGMELKNLSSQEKKQRDLSRGVKITSANNRILSMYGIGEGFVLLEINGQSIDDISKLDGFPEEDIESLLILTPDDERIIFRN